MIPKKIHYCWFGGAPVPESVQKCIDSWKKYCPDYEIILWNEDNFDISKYAYAYNAYQARKWAYVSDVARLAIIYNEGGIYLDTDIELLKNMDFLLEYDSFWGFENSNHIATGLGFGAVQHNEFVKALLADYAEQEFCVENDTVKGLPCPDLNTRVLKDLGVEINNKYQNINNNVFLPTDYLCPIDYQTGKCVVSHNTVSIHHYDSSWHTEYEKRMHKKEARFCRVFGKKAGKKLFNAYALLTQKGMKALFAKMFHGGATK